MKINKVSVFCASSSKCDKVYLDAAEELGRKIAQSGREIIYGGGNIGLMNRLADGALSAGGKVIGVIPNFLQNLELGHNKIAELREVVDMHKREAMMMLEADCIVALPGGCGTFSELTQAITWKCLGLILAPIIIVNMNDYFAPLLEMYERAVQERFMNKDLLRLWKVVQSIEEAMQVINIYSTFKERNSPAIKKRGKGKYFLRNVSY